MGQAIGEILPMAIGVGLSPLPIIAVVLLLGSGRASTNGPAFLAGWLTGLAIIGVIMLAIIGPTAGTDVEKPTWVAVLVMVLGALLVLVAIAQWRKRPKGDEQPEQPKWMATIDTFTPAKSFVVGGLLSGLNPKNTLLAIAAATEIGQLGLSGTEQAVAYAVFVLIGSIGVAAPLVIYFGFRDKSAKILADLKEWMSHNNATIMAVMCLIIGFKLLGDGIAAL